MTGPTRAAGAPTEVGDSYDAALRLLDRQILDPDGLPAGNVDDLELRRAPNGTLAVAALLVGPGAWGPRLGGRLGRWVVTAWRRLSPRDGGTARAEPARIRFEDVVGIDSAVRVTARGASAAADAAGLERWLGEHVIGRIPGAGGSATPSRPEPAQPEPAQPEPAQPGPAPPGPDDRFRLGALLGVPVVGADGAELGHVNDVRVVRRPGGALPVVDGIVVGDRHAGSLLRYDRRPEQGPWLVRVVVRRLHRHACYVPWRAVTSLDLGSRTLVVDARQARPLPSSPSSAT